MVKKIIITLLVLFIGLILVSSVYALTADIGNARMILQAKVGDTISKSVLVQNVNNVSVDITAYASGDMENATVIQNPRFTLQPGEDNKINFTINFYES